MTLVATLDELKAQLNYTGSNSNDTELTMYLTAASEYVESVVGPLAVATFTETAQLQTGFLALRKRPVVAITSITPQLSATSLDATNYELDSAANGVRFLYGVATNWSAGWFTVVYTAGLASIPTRVKLAGLIIAAHLWRTQNGGGGLPFPGEDETVPTGFGFAIPRRAEELLSRDMMFGFA